VQGAGYSEFEVETNAADLELKTDTTALKLETDASALELETYIIVSGNIEAGEFFG
jgi:hypothetical protein